MKMRITGMAMMAALLAACGQAPEKTGETAPAVAPAPTTEAPAATATVVEKKPSAEDGVDPSVWDNEGEPEDPSAGGELTCADNPLATHFFTLVGGNTVDNCGRADAKVTAAFDELMKEAAQGDIADPDVPSQRERLLSGPSGPGVPKTLGRETWWFYTACQAHQCGTHQLAMLYQPEQARLVGRLLSRCKVWWLGNPSAEQRELIDDTAPVDASLLRSDGSTCDDEL